MDVGWHDIGFHGCGRYVVLALIVSYLRAVASDIGSDEWEQLRQHMLKYCERDTWAMVRLER